MLSICKNIIVVCLLTADLMREKWVQAMALELPRPTLSITEADYIAMDDIHYITGELS